MIILKYNVSVSNVLDVFLSSLFQESFESCSGFFFSFFFLEGGGQVTHAWWADS